MNAAGEIHKLPPGCGRIRYAAGFATRPGATAVPVENSGTQPLAASQCTLLGAAVVGQTAAADRWHPGGGTSTGGRLRCVAAGRTPAADRVLASPRRPHLNRGAAAAAGRTPAADRALASPSRLHLNRGAAAAAGRTPAADRVLASPRRPHLNRGRRPDFGGGPGACLTTSPAPQPGGGCCCGPDPSGGPGSGLPSEFGAFRAARSGFNVMGTCCARATTEPVFIIGIGEKQSSTFAACNAASMSRSNSARKGAAAVLSFCSFCIPGPSA